MAEEKQKRDSGTDETLKDADKAIEGEKLSEDELDAVAGGTIHFSCVRLDIANPDRPRCQFG